MTSELAEEAFPETISYDGVQVPNPDVLAARGGFDAGVVEVGDVVRDVRTDYVSAGDPAYDSGYHAALDAVLGRLEAVLDDDPNS